MVSPLWNAASEGDTATVNHLLSDGSGGDIEIKNEEGATPLFQAVSKGHVEVVRALLAQGASIHNCPQLAQPEQVTSHPEVLELLRNAGNALPPSHPSATYENGADGMGSPYHPHPNGYPYFPTLNGPPFDGPPYYPLHNGQPHLGEQSPTGGFGHLPPPDIARMIPCRYFPACRYGPTCMFAHPQQAPYFPPSMPPPGQYSPGYDPRAPPYTPSYYGVPQPSYPHPNGGGPMSPMSPPSAPQHPGMIHTRSGSEVSPQPGAPFSPNHMHPIPFSPVQPISPSGYSHPGPPMGVPPQAHGPPHSGPQSPSVYSPPSYPTRANGVHAFVPNGFSEPNGLPAVHGPHGEGAHRGPIYRDGSGHARRGGFRRPFVDKRKPPCIFYPSGKCKNGDDCRFLHVSPHDNHPSYQHGFYSGRGRRGGFAHTNGVSHVADKLAEMTVRSPEHPHRAPIENGHSRGRSMGANHVKPAHQPQMNGVKNYDKRPGFKPQRVPQADEFPALAGSSTPRNRSPGSTGSVNGSAPTAAQVLSRPPPQRGDSGAQTREPSPEPAAQLAKPVHEEKPAGPILSVPSNIVHAVTAAPVKPSIPSFAAIASPAAATAPSKELSVSA